MHLPVKVLIIGAGNRGQIYSSFAKDFPERMKVVGVADCRQVARRNLQMKYSVADYNVFDDWRGAASQEKFADAVIIATPDRQHKEPAVAFAEKGYHILLEKPMAVTVDDCKDIIAACKKHNVMLAVCHVLRYSPAILKIKELLSQGVIGEVVHIQHLEPVGFYHFAHSFVRGNWRNEQESTFSLMAKSCHDIDIINSLIEKRCIKVSSFGSLSHFTKENKPQGAASRCLNCAVEQNCPYSAKKLYLEGVKNGELSSEGQDPVKVFDFLTQTKKEYPLDYSILQQTRLSGHGGADYYLMDSFIQAVAENNPSLIKTGPEETLASHLLVFDAEHARRENRIVYCN
ncbi:putative 4,5-dihydroxyphthalate dehydrogenase isoform X2 [Hypanus sabinus]|uniref:putative 4,5-dihydroxyphthalate dehydrogenase isoform X2 n=1 Tax=Hypanus sabinus TaxID=79690 RepID=UPI0028C3DC87|nr:putative 4,5-dihydroxyphthalate dehydrogenase isoform X2 [Hypanus sabinus]